MAIDVEQLTMRFRVSRREPGLRRSAAAMLRRSFEEVVALDDVTFSVGEGEVIGFLGPNGAGKTTTLKCLSGLLHPTSGAVRVFGHTPHQREGDFLRGISLVMGQRNSLFWDLPALDAFEVNRSIYRIPEAGYRATLDGLVDLLDLAPLLTKQVRVLSLGERMRCELAAALLHRPRVLFLDEPTLGLDVTAQAAVRGFLADYNARSGATVLLTSHYMGDVTALARRVVVIDAGRLRFDGDLEELSRRYVSHRLIKLRLREHATLPVPAEVGDVVARDGLTLTVQVEAERTAAAAGRLLTDLPVEDLSIEEPPMEDVVRAFFERR